MECSCSAFSGDDDYACHWSERNRKANKPHICYECGGTIHKGEEYVFHTLFGDGSIENFKICYGCQSVIKQFYPNGWVFGAVWDYLADYIYTSWSDDLPSSCISKLDTTVRDKVCDLIEKVWQEIDKKSNLHK